MPCQLWKQADFQIPSVHSVFIGTEEIKFLKPEIWENLPPEIKQLEAGFGALLENLEIWEKSGKTQGKLFLQSIEVIM